MKRRRYSFSEKASAVAEAERTSVLAASQSTGIPEQTLRYWYHAPEFADLRGKTRDELADGSLVLAILAQGEIVRQLRAGELTGQALVTAYGVAVDKAQLLAGMATARTENRDISGTLADVDIAAAVREADDIARSGSGGVAPAAEGATEG